MLTREMFIDGTIDVETVKIKDIKAFCDQEGFEINCAPARGKAKILNEVVEALEADALTADELPQITANEPETVTVSTEQEKPVEAPQMRENGEVIRLAKDGKDYGSNLQNRMH